MQDEQDWLHEIRIGCRSRTGCRMNRVACRTSRIGFMMSRVE